MSSNGVVVSEHELEAVVREFSDAPEVVLMACRETRNCPGTWVACPQILTLRQWIRFVIGLPLGAIEPQLAIQWHEQSKEWRVTKAKLIPDLQGRFNQERGRFRIPGIHLEYYYP